MAFYHYTNSEENGNEVIGSASTGFPSASGSYRGYCVPECYFFPPQFNAQVVDSLLPSFSEFWILPGKQSFSQLCQ